MHGILGLKEGRTEMIAMMKVEKDWKTNELSIGGAVGMTDTRHHNSKNSDFGLLKRLASCGKVKVLMVIPLSLVGPSLSDQDRLAWDLRSWVNSTQKS